MFCKAHKDTEGENISGQLRYGYVKDPNDKHKIIVDPEAAEVVKLIFELTAQGKRKRKWQIT